MKTNYLIFLLTIMFFTSCSSGKYYANYRVGGKSKKEEKILPKENQLVLEDNKSLSDKKEFILNEIVCVDTFSLHPKEKNGPAYQIKNSTIKSHEILATVKKINPIKNSLSSKLLTNLTSRKDKKIKTLRKKIYTKTTSQISFEMFNLVLEKRNTVDKKNKKRILAISLFALLLIACLSLSIFIGKSFWVWAAIITVSAILLFILFYVTLLCLFLYLIRKKGAVFSSLKSFPKKVNHQERITVLFWTLIGLVVIGGIITAILLVPNFVLIALGLIGALLFAALLGAVFAAFIDLIMPGDSIF